MLERHTVSRAACIVAAATFFAAALAGGSLQSAGAAPAPPRAQNPIIGNWKNKPNGQFEAVELGNSNTYALVTVNKHFKPPLSQCSPPAGTPWAIVSGTNSPYKGEEDVNYVVDTKTKTCVPTSTAPVTVTVQGTILTDSIDPTEFKKVRSST